MREYLLSSAIDHIKQGDTFPEGQLPRHVTVLQWFTLENQAAFRNALMNYVTTLKPFDVIAGDEALYGPKNDTPVRLLRSIGALARIHSGAVELIERFGGELQNPQWSGDSYSPHVTAVNGVSLDEGEAVTLRSLELIGREQGSKLGRAELVLPFSKCSR